MRYALHPPNFGDYGDPRLLAELAHEAEDAGWDGFFLWDHYFWKHPENQPVAEPWIALAAMATATSRIRIGPLITPLARRHPWTVARQAATLDHLSGGRLILGVGLGGDWFGDYSAFGNLPDDKTRGEMLDEALDIIAGLWSGRPFSYSGRHYQVSDAELLPPPLQQPRIPIWVAGTWPNKKPYRRAARWDGVAAEAAGDNTLSPQDIRDIRSYIQEQRGNLDDFEVTSIGQTPGDDPAAAAAIVAPYAEAGVTWWLERVGGEQERSLEEMRKRIRQGPPRM